MLEVLKNVGLELLQLVLITILPILATYLVRLIKANIEEALAGLTQQQHDLLDKVVQIAVLAAEQLNLAGFIEDKKAFAVEYVQNYLNQNGITLDVAAIEGAVEAAVMAEFNKQKALPE